MSSRAVWASSACGKGGRAELCCKLAPYLMESSAARVCLGTEPGWTCLPYQDMDDRVTLDMDPLSRAISQSRVLTIHGDDDQTIPVEDASSFHERIKVLCLQSPCRFVGMRA